MSSNTDIPAHKQTRLGQHMGVCIGRRERAIMTQTRHSNAEQPARSLDKQSGRTVVGKQLKPGTALHVRQTIKLRDRETNKGSQYQHLVPDIPTQLLSR